MIDTRLWSSTPFNNPTAWNDLTGSLELFHHALAQRTFVLTGRSYAVLPLGTGRGQSWLEALQKQNQDAAAALGTAPPPDLESYELDTPGDFASWAFTLGQFSRQLAVDAGLV